MTRRFALHFAFAFNMSKITWALLPEVETRGLGPQCRAGSRLSYYIYYLQRPENCSTFRKHDFANLAVPLTCVVLNLQYSASLRSPFPISSERRCSSRTFRYGYLVTT